MFSSTKGMRLRGKVARHQMNVAVDDSAINMLRVKYGRLRGGDEFFMNRSVFTKVNDRKALSSENRMVNMHKDCRVLPYV